MRIEQAVTDAHLRRLLETDPAQGPLITLILPMERGGPEVRKNSVMLKNAARQTRTLLAEAGRDAEEIDQQMAPVEALIEDDSFWQHQNRTLGLYVGAEGFSPFILGYFHPERVVVGSRFYLTPLLHAAQHQDAAYVLTLSQNHVSLMVLHRGRLEPVEVEGLPTDRDDALQLEAEQTLRDHTGSMGGQRDGAPVMGTQGRGGAKDMRLPHLEEFIHRVEGPVTRFMEGRGVPLYLATVEENDALYRKINKYSRLAPYSLQGNFDRQPPHQLLETLAQQIEEDMGNAVRDRSREILEAAGSGNGTTDLDEAIAVAWDGRVHACCVALGSPPRTGEWDPVTRTVSHDAEPNPLHPDLVDLVASNVWEKGGDLNFVEPEILPEGSSVVVSLRY